MTKSRVECRLQLAPNFLGTTRQKAGVKLELHFSKSQGPAELKEKWLCMIYSYLHLGRLVESSIILLQEPDSSTCLPPPTL